MIRRILSLVVLIQMIGAVYSSPLPGQNPATWLGTLSLWDSGPWEPEPHLEFGTETATEPIDPATILPVLLTVDRSARPADDWIWSHFMNLTPEPAAAKKAR